ncbi:GH12 family glycosyl hydrolase domain-containing protein [Marinifilum caeruleilacunae]|uniref:Glycosyl hydrolase family 12 n=1 Tax=Marinifilum caeruleilacunae TaxID=2499076 RepID=A0ABX1WU79_9BACT|nr:hypothetical protein [Marinifilum caeruleilacunae]NOU59521.1 hypothetical protein [Marinifilum caeruleilacunae]
MLNLVLEAEGISYQTSINENIVIPTNLLPYGTQHVEIKNIEISPKASINRFVGEILQTSNSPIAMEVRAEDGNSIRTYQLRLNMEENQDFRKLLFEESTESNCDLFSVINADEFRLENNAWNASNLPSNSYSQCIYKYDENDLLLLGWQWSYPDNAYGVNAFPQIIYGWKPWQPNSSTEKLPIKISEINSLKASYEITVERNSGDYNLSFDNWINSSANIAPENILFEFMIWEDANNLVPFGDYIEDVNTSNGTYKFYMGEPDWEPEGSNWTYLAFQRTNHRQSGTVDIDELLQYLVEKEIISQDSYLASIEFGNEVGNSKGESIIKKFELDLN